MKANMKMIPASIPHKKSQLLADILENYESKYFWLQFIREEFLAFLSTYEDFSRLIANEIMNELRNNGFLVVVSQKLVKQNSDRGKF